MLSSKTRSRATLVGRVPAARFPGLSALTRAWLESPAARPLARAGGDSSTPAAAAIAAYRERTSPDRAALASVVRDGLARAGVALGPEREASLAALARPRSVAIVTGQQAGFATGPLYTLYKALTVVAIARSLRAAGERDVVPVFWCASDDHDLAEIDGLRAPDTEGGEVRKFRSGIGAITRTPAFAVTVSADVREAFERYAAAHPKTDFSESVRAALGPRDGESLATWFLRSLAGLPGLEELLPVEGRSLVGPFGSRVVAAELADPAASSRAFEAGAGAIRARGFEPALAALTAPFLYEVRETAGRWERVPVGETRRLAGVASPNVALRPVVQGEVLPAAVVVGGPGEIAYLSQLGPLFERHGVPSPALAPRFSATLVDARSEKTLRGLGLEPETLFDLPSRAPTPAAAGVPDAFDRNAEAATVALAAIEREAAAADATLEKPARKLRESTVGALGKLREKIAEAAGAASETSLRRFRRLLGSVLPDGEPQERVFGPWTFLNQFGLDLARSIGEIVDPDDARHAVVRASTEESESA